MARLCQAIEQRPLMAAPSERMPTGGANISPFEAMDLPVINLWDKAAT